MTKCFNNSDKTLPDLMFQRPVSRQYSRSRTPDVSHSQSYMGGPSTASSSMAGVSGGGSAFEATRSAFEQSLPPPSQSPRNVVYIPVRVPGGGRAQAPRAPQGLLAPNSQSDTDDVKDALSKFDYLNEYETSSRGSRF